MKRPSQRSMPRIFDLRRCVLICIWMAALSIEHQAVAATGPSTTVSISTDEGTWMNVDVSPDGESLVFDLLGDIYWLPIEGGDARPLLVGDHWETQPRFSPTGESIAFISDRSGIENIWTLDMAELGGERRVTQISTETHRTMNAPAWSPDGRRIVGRKHYTAQRTIGAGEIWSYSANGGDARRLVPHANTQKDQNEPVYTPLGDAVLYSADITSTEGFEYYRNPHTGLFAIMRYDLAAGASAPLHGGIGGAVRPLMSPDSRWLAYISRQKFTTALMVKNTQDGEERVLADSLDIDLQELWSNSGYYPAYDWTPDSKSIVFWAGGKLRRVALDTGRVRIIPFKVEATKRVASPPRNRSGLQGNPFPVKALRWVEVSPAGDRVAYQALGKIYIKALPDGAPRRLTTQEQNMEAFPTFSPDGKWIVHTTWHDERLGRVVRTRIADGREVVLTRNPGHYVEPRVSTDGSRIAYRQILANAMVSGRWAITPGIYENTWSGNAQSFVTGDGVEPQYCGSDNQLFVTRAEPIPAAPPRSAWHSNRSLVKVGAGSDPQKLFKTKFGENHRLSADCKWLAWVERGDVYVSPLGKGRADSNDNSRSVRMPGSGGVYPSWSQNNTLHWSLGGDLFTKTIAAAEDSPVGRVAIGFEHSADAPGQVIALTGGRLITMRGREIIDNGTLIIRGNRIAAVGPAEDTKVPDGAHIVPLNGRVVSPGLIDSHWHGYAHYGVTRKQSVITQQDFQLYATLAFGVTTVYEPYALRTEDTFADSELIRAGLKVGPRILSTGTALYGADDEITAIIDSRQDAARYVRRKQALGAIGLKSYLQPRRDQRQDIIAAAREEGVVVTAEGSMSPANAMSYVADGHSSVEHRLLPAVLYDDVVQLWRGTKVSYTPTLTVNGGGFPGEGTWYHSADVWRHPILSKLVPASLLYYTAARRQLASEADNSFLAPSRSAGRLHENGVRVLVGSHGQREGLGFHWELWMLAKGGMSAHAVLKAATIDSAEHFGIEQDLGSLEVGKLADLVVFGSDPLTNILGSDDVDLVMQNGRLYDVPSMDELGPMPRRRAPFHWEASCCRSE